MLYDLKSSKHFPNFLKGAKGPSSIQGRISEPDFNSLNDIMQFVINNAFAKRTSTCKLGKIFLERKDDQVEIKILIESDYWIGVSFPVEFLQLRWKNQVPNLKNSWNQHSPPPPIPPERMFTFPWFKH